MRQRPCSDRGWFVLLANRSPRSWLLPEFVSSDLFMMYRKVRLLLGVICTSVRPNVFQVSFG